MIQFSDTHDLENVPREVNDLVAEGGPALASDDKRVATRRSWKESIGHLAPVIRGRLMAKYSITFNGRHYETGGHRYDLLADAVMNAKLRRSQNQRNVAPALRPEFVETPTVWQRRLMAKLAITYVDGVYHFGAYRYDRLLDAVNYAQLRWKLVGKSEDV